MNNCIDHLDAIQFLPWCVCIPKDADAKAVRFMNSAGFYQLD